MSSCIGKIRQNISKKQSFFSLCVKKCGLRVVDEQNPLFLLFLCTTPCVFLLLVPRPVLWLMCDDESRPWAGVRGPLPFFCCFCCGIAFCLSVLLTTSFKCFKDEKAFLVFKLSGYRGIKTQENLVCYIEKWKARNYPQSASPNAENKTKNTKRLEREFRQKLQIINIIIRIFAVAKEPQAIKSTKKR